MAGPQESSTSSGSRKSGSRAVGQFNIGSEIGKGSFAQVYLGWHKVRHSFYPDLASLPHHRTMLRCQFVAFALPRRLIGLLPWYYESHTGTLARPIYIHH
jgi:serine/threonine protein kinase